MNTFAHLSYPLVPLGFVFTYRGEAKYGGFDWVITHPKCPLWIIHDKDFDKFKDPADVINDLIDHLNMEY